MNANGFRLQQHKSQDGQSLPADIRRSDLKRRSGELVSIPVYGMGPRNDTDETWQAARKQLNDALTMHCWLTPAAVAVFGGVDPPKRRIVLKRDLRDPRLGIDVGRVGPEEPGTSLRSSLMR